ncbi:Diacylglycerol O-acyltransferase 1 [Chlorella sorokiniana]|uniref:Diacylglycerol O-acyltransferase 1 n=1 Tax=Chlorella sorokiniana TaxID=3076 RepID=A0A2P6TSC9_CHLSO|nr:Diacylglycerol O-acyltransferase 1 [Chlorella sorokiniana]|eukprot:PRW56972.1 Diacylglycerol O-acyltransferase 1 [Chlorella sorokiniana]
MSLSISAALAAVTGDALLSAAAVASACTLLAHLGGVALCQRDGSGGTCRFRLPGPRVELHFLLSGGARHLVLQAFSWALCFGAVLVAMPLLLARWRQAQTPHMELLSAAVAVAAYCALLFQVKGLLVFEPGEPVQLLARTFASGSSSLYWDVSRLPSRTARAYIVTGIGLLWVGLGGALLLATEFLTDTVSLSVYYALAAACVTVGAFTTHGLAGFLRHSEGSSSSKGGKGGGGSANGGWRFWQPFRGGTAFVLAQALGWALYSSVLVACLYLLVQAVAGVAYCVRCWAVAAGLVMFLSELLLAGSLLTFQAPAAVQAIKAAALDMAAPSQLARMGLRERLLNLLIISILYIPMHLFFAVGVLTFMVLPATTATALWLGGLFVYYSATAFGQPEHTGRREWPAFQAWMGAQLERFLPAWLGSCEVVLDGGKSAAEAFDPQQRYIFGFQHHGLYPLGAGYLPLLHSFKRLLPVRPVTLTASVCVTVPLLRDIVLWLGIRIVSRRTFEHTLQERKAVLICPGGQAEMCLTNRLHRHKEFSVYSRHKGFVRMALKHDAALVPVLALGEADSLRNLIEWPAMQRWCTKKLGFPIPFIIAGRWCLPLPAPTGLRFVIGQPLRAPKLAKEGEPTEEEVDAFHAQFYASLKDLWARHAPKFPGYEGVKLVVV